MPNTMIEHELDQVVGVKVMGVGGGGGNAINRMVMAGLTGMEFIAVNTDRQVLRKSQAAQKIEIGLKTTKGTGAGGDPAKGAQAAEESRDEIATALKSTQMLFITAGMGGGTGTGSAPIIAQIAREMGILTVGVVTKPFVFEGPRRMQQAESGIEELRNHVDSLVVVPNERLKLLSNQKITLANAFEAADNVLKQGVQSISELINTTGFINLDFADVSAIMRDAGYAHMGVGYGEGKEKAVAAAEMAVSSPLLETSIDGAKGLIINVTAPPTVEFDEVETASSRISQAVHPEASVIFGVAFDDSLDDEIKVTVIATGFDTDFKEKISKTKMIDVGLDGPKDKKEKDVNSGLSPDDNTFDVIMDIFKNKN